MISLGTLQRRWYVNLVHTRRKLLSTTHHILADILLLGQLDTASK